MNFKNFKQLKQLEEELKITSEDFTQQSKVEELKQQKDPDNMTPNTQEIWKEVQQNGVRKEDIEKRSHAFRAIALNIIKKLRDNKNVPPELENDIIEIEAPLDGDFYESIFKVIQYFLAYSSGSRA